MNGVKKFSELDPLTPNGTERIPAIQDDAGTWVNGYVEATEVGTTIYNSDGTITGFGTDRTITGTGKKLIWLDFDNILHIVNDEILMSFVNPSTTDPNFKLITSSPNDDDLLIGIDTGSGVQTYVRNDGQIDSIRGVRLGSREKLDDQLVFDTESASGANSRGTRPFPRIVQVDRDLYLATPPDFTQIINTTTKLPEYYHPTFGWVGLVERSVFVQATLSTLSGTTSFFGNTPINASTPIANRQFKSPFSGKITACYLRLYTGGTVGDRTFEIYVRINDTTDYLIGSAAAAVNVEYVNVAMNTTGIPVTANSTNIALKIVSVSGTTSSTNVSIGGTLIIQ